MRSNYPSWVEVLPLHELGLLVVLADVAHGLSLEIGYRGEYAASDHVALDLGEPQFNLVEPCRLGRARQHTRLKAVGDLVALATGMARKQAFQTVRSKALAPESNVAVIAIELGPDGAPGQSLGKQQDQTRTTRQIRSKGPSIGLLPQFHDFGFGQIHRALQGSNFTIYLNVIVHYHPSQDLIVRDVGKQELLAVGKPQRAFQPAAAFIQALQFGVRQDQSVEARVQS